MVCLECGSKLDITNSRPQLRSNQVWRRRKCLECGELFTSHEAIDLSAYLKVESQNGTKPFLTDKLFADLLDVLKDRKDAHIAARSITNTVINKLLDLPSKPVFLSQEITRETSAILKRFDRKAYLRHIAEHPWIS